MIKNPKISLLSSCLFLAAILTTSIFAQDTDSVAGDSQWLTYGGNLGHTRHVDLDQINAGNFSRLEIAWRFKTDNLGTQPEFNFQSTPLMANGVLYTTAGTRRAVTALDAQTGEQLWVYSLQDDEEELRASRSPRRLSGRGLSYWSDGEQERIYYVTIGYQLIALDAQTGRPIADFGINGKIDLLDSLEQDINFDIIQIGYHSPPLIANDVIIIGSAHNARFRDTLDGIKGYVRAFDVRTGRHLWTFHTTPQDDEYGSDTWLENSAQYAGYASVWTRMSADEELNLAYLPVESPYSDYYGGRRPGNNLFGETLVAVDISTGERKWHYQIVHHPLWDYDIPAAPILFDIEKDGETIKALAQPTKQALLFVLNRETGEPIWPIPEVPVPQGNVPGEWYSPTQPIPSIQYGKVGISEDDLIDFTPELEAEARRVAAQHIMGPLYTPPTLQSDGRGAALFVRGGNNWPGGSFDPDNGMLYLNASIDIGGISVCPNPPGSELPYDICEGGDFVGVGMDVQGLPLLKPPYGVIVAIDMNRGEVAWEIPNAATPDEIRQHPALAGIDIGRTGRPGWTPGPLTTRTLLIVPEPGFGPTPDGRRGAMIRAYDKISGVEVGAIQVPAPASGAPMSYEINGVQYLVVAVSGSNYSGELLAFRVHEEGSTIASSLPDTSSVTLEQIQGSRHVWQGIFSGAQAARGQTLYAEHCSECHGGNLQGLEMAPALRGLNFNANWNRQTLDTMLNKMLTMPPTEPNSLTTQAYLDLLAFTLDSGGFPRGNSELDTDDELGAIYFTSGNPDN